MELCEKHIDFYDGCLVCENEKLQANLSIAVKAIEIMTEHSHNPAHTLTKIGLEEITDANYKIGNETLVSEKTGLHIPSEANRIPLE